VGGLIGVMLTKKRLGVTASSGDLLVFPLLLGLSIGRLGCFFSGLEDGTYGTATALPWGANFGDGIPRHPTNLYEILFLGVLALLLWLLERWRGPLPLGDGRRFKLFLSGYLLFRLLVEFMKPKAALPGLVYYVWVWKKSSNFESL